MTRKNVGVLLTEGYNYSIIIIVYFVLKNGNNNCRNRYISKIGEGYESIGFCF